MCAHHMPALASWCLALRQWRKNADPDATAAEQEAEASQLGAEVQVRGEYDGLVAAPPH